VSPKDKQPRSYHGTNTTSATVNNHYLIFTAATTTGFINQSLAATSKEIQRFFSAGVPTITKGATSSTNRLIKKFVASSPESIALDALSHLLSPDFTHPLLPSPTLPVSNNPPTVT
jgi:hypothetical protein